MQLLLVLLEVYVSDLGRHTKFRDHSSGHACDFVEVVTGTASHRVEVEFFAYATAKSHCHSIHELFDIHQVRITLRREILGITQSTLATGDDGYFQ